MNVLHEGNEWALVEFSEFSEGSADPEDPEGSAGSATADLLIFRYKDGVQVTLDVARAVIALATELVGERAPVPTLVHIGTVAGVSRDARDFFANSPENAALSSHVALIVQSPIARVLANFFMGLNKPRIPTRMFTQDSQAKIWLERDGDHALSRVSATPGAPGRTQGHGRARAPSNQG